MPQTHAPLNEAAPPAEAERGPIVVDPTAPLVAATTLIAFHGLTETHVQMQSYSGLDVLAASAACRVVYPLGSRVPPRLPLVRGWDFWHADSRDLARVRELCGQYAAGRAAVMLGFSAGACFANTIACAASGLVAAVVSYAGYLGRGWQLPPAGDSPYPVLILRNGDDRLVRADETAALCDAYTRAGHLVDFHELPASGATLPHELNALLQGVPRTAHEGALDWALRLSRHYPTALADLLRKLGHWWQPAATDIVRTFLEKQAKTSSLQSISG